VAACPAKTIKAKISAKTGAKPWIRTTKTATSGIMAVSLSEADD
jgi:hypothetical protein